jgi:hypothetical protein
MCVKPFIALLLIEGKTMRCKQARHYNDELFRRVPE